MQLSWLGFIQDIFFIEFFKNLAERKGPDDIFGNIIQKTSRKLIDENIDEQPQAKVIGICFSPEE
jgi:hypothetical protein